MRCSFLPHYQKAKAWAKSVSGNAVPTWNKAEPNPEKKAAVIIFIWEENGLFSFLANSIFTNSSCCEAEELLAKIFLKLLKECLQETRQKEQAHSQQYHQKLRQQQSLLLEKYLEGLIDESLYKEKQLDLQSKIQEQNIRNIPKENSHRSFPTPEERLETIRQFLLQNQCISKACVLACWKL